MRFGKKVLIIFFIVGLLTLGYVMVILLSDRSDSPPANQNNTGVPEEADTGAEAKTGFDKSRYSTKAPDSLWVVVNKQHSLPNDYVPADLIVPDVRLRLASSAEQMKFRRVAEANLEAMFTAAAREDVTMVFGSGYRSSALQKQFYDSYVARDGQAAADRYSARPGHSEHQTGLAFDATSPTQTCHLEICFEDTPQGEWLAEHSHEYGFTLRYPKGKENITGYQYEPWHFRYIGRKLAAELHKTNQTLEEFFGL